MGIHDVNATQLILKVAEELKKEPQIKPTAWAPFVKTGISRERAPMQDDWWYIRAAAILRKLFMLGPIGTHKLQTKFGGRKNRGSAPDKFFAGAGNHIRKILQQLEKAGLAKQTQKGVHKGRIATPKGQSLLELAANAIMKEQGTVLPKASKIVELPSEEVKEEKKEEKQKKPRAPRKPKAKKEESTEAANGAQ